MGDRLGVLVLLTSFAFTNAFGITVPIARKYAALRCARLTAGKIDPSQQSFADQFPELVEDILKVEWAMRDYDAILRRSRRVDTGTLLQSSADARRAEARRLYRLANRYEQMRAPQAL